MTSRLKRLTDLIQNLGIVVESEEELASKDGPALFCCGSPENAVAGSVLVDCEKCGIAVSAAPSTQSVIRKRRERGLPVRIFCIRCMTAYIKSTKAN